MTTLISAIVFGLIGVTLLGYIVATLLHAFPFTRIAFPKVSVRGISEGAKLKKAARDLNAADELLKARHTPASLSEVRRLFQSSLCLESLFYSDSVLREVLDHQQTILERIVALSEQYSIHLDLLPNLEDLLMARGELLRENLETVRVRSDLAKKQKEKGRTVPEWAKSEYERKIIVLQERINTNRKSIESTLHDLLISLFAEARGRESDVTYH